MPALQKFHANVARHVKAMNKNLCANLIRHEFIVTTRAKAKRAQAEIESFLSNTLQEGRSMKKLPLEQQLKSNKSLRYLQPPDLKEVGTKVLTELAQRYPQRHHGFTRIIKLEPRLGEDKAPMSVLELVDSNYDIKFWYTAKIVARLQLQGLELDETTRHEMNKLTRLNPDGVAKFEEAVATAKREFFKVDGETGEIEDEEIKQNLKNLPRHLEYHSATSNVLLGSKKFKTKSRPARPDTTVEVPKSPFLQ